MCHPSDRDEFVRKAFFNSFNRFPSIGSDEAVPQTPRLHRNGIQGCLAVNLFIFLRFSHLAQIKVLSGGRELNLKFNLTEYRYGARERLEK